MVHSRSMMEHYNNRADLTSAIEWRDERGRRVFRSGGLGFIDEEGFLHLTGRKKDLIISGGFNIYATDLERVLAGHEDVAEVAVIGVADGRWGEVPLAIIVKRHGACCTEAQVLHWANERLGKLQRLGGVEFRDALPRGTLDKVLKQQLREEYAKPRVGTAL